MVKFQASGYDLFRNSESKVFTHSVVFYNKQQKAMGADFHISLELAEANRKKIDKRFWLEVIAIVPVKQVA